MTPWYGFVAVVVLFVLVTFVVVAEFHAVGFDDAVGDVDEGGIDGDPRGHDHFSFPG